MAYLAPLLLVSLVLLSACGSDEVKPTPPPTLPRSTRAAATSTPPVATPVAPVTPRTPLNPAGAGPVEGANVCPFTGMPLNGVKLGERRPLLVKIGNSPPERPQSGLAQADVVVEHLTEGGITRFSALFYCTDAAEIGPIRSARLIDLELVPMFGAIFAHVGGSEPVRQMIAASEIARADFDDYGRAPIFREVESRKRPFNRYTSTDELWILARDEGWVGATPVPLLPFDANVPAGGRPATTVTIPYRSTLADAVFTYDPAARRYRRSVGTTPHLDASTNQPLTAANVIILRAPHETTTIVEDSLGSRSIKITTMGSGSATILRDGQAYDVTWLRSDPHAFWSFTDAQGKPIALEPGNTWIEIVAPDMQVQLQ